jgi:hypothetical protein
VVTSREVAEVEVEEEETKKNDKNAESKEYTANHHTTTSPDVQATSELNVYRVQAPNTNNTHEHD